jgi:hypothetical protein
MAFFRELDRGIGERATALVDVGNVIRHLAEPGTKLRELSELVAQPSGCWPRHNRARS